MNKTATTIVLAFVLVTGMSEAGEMGDSGKNLVPLAPPIMEGNCLSYDFIDLEYGINEFGNGYQADGDFFGVGFSKSLGSTLFFTGSYADGGYDYNCDCEIIPVDTRRYRLGLGAHKEIGKCVDLTFEGGGEHRDAEYEHYSDLDYDSWGYYFGPGIRARAGRFEMFAKAFYQGSEGDMSQAYLSQHSTVYGRVDDYSWVFNPGIIFHVTEHFGFKVAAEIEERDTAITFGGRYQF